MASLLFFVFVVVTIVKVSGWVAPMKDPETVDDYWNHSPEYRAAHHA